MAEFGKRGPWINSTRRLEEKKVRSVGRNNWFAHQTRTIILLAQSRWKRLITIRIHSICKFPHDKKRLLAQTVSIHSSIQFRYRTTAIFSRSIVVRRCECKSLFLAEVRHRVPRFYFAYEDSGKGTACLKRMKSIFYADTDPDPRDGNAIQLSGERHGFREVTVCDYIIEWPRRCQLYWE